MLLHSEVLELRGVVRKTSKKGNVYFIFNMEGLDGEARSFMCFDQRLLDDSCRKGNKYHATFEYTLRGNMNLVHLEPFDGKQ